MKTIELGTSLELVDKSREIDASIICIEETPTTGYSYA
jgi:hypothetical protein